MELADFNRWEDQQYVTVGAPIVLMDNTKRQIRTRDQVVIIARKDLLLRRHQQHALVVLNPSTKHKIPWPLSHVHRGHHVQLADLNRWKDHQHATVSAKIVLLESTKLLDLILEQLRVIFVQRGTLLLPPHL